MTSPPKTTPPGNAFHDLYSGGYRFAHSHLLFGPAPLWIDEVTPSNGVHVIGGPLNEPGGEAIGVVRGPWKHGMVLRFRTFVLKSPFSF